MNEDYIEDAKQDFMESTEKAVEDIQYIRENSEYLDEVNSPKYRAEQLEGEMQYNRLYDRREYALDVKFGTQDKIDRLWKRHEYETGATTMPTNLNTDIAKDMRTRYPDLSPKVEGLVKDYMQAHPEQPRYTRQEIRAMIDAALPALEERKKELAQDLSRSHHGYEL